VFGARLYRSFARSLSRRLRAAQSTLGGKLTRARTSPDPAVQGGCAGTFAQLEATKRMLSDADHQAIRNSGKVPDALTAGIRKQFRTFCDQLNRDLGDTSTLSPEQRKELGARVQQDVLPYMLLTRNGERCYSKPRGYAGDFLSIEWIYRDAPEGSGRLGALLDRCFLDQPAAQAVRNRRGLLVEEIRQTMEEAGERPARVLNMACGPAREIFDTFEMLPDPARLTATCLDMDRQALELVAQLRDRRKLKNNIRLEHANLLPLVMGRQRIDLEPLDLAYSIGLIDYFKDAFVVKLLDFVHDHLRPGGRVILGNFHPRNPTRAFMDHVLEWKLIHRDEADMNRLFAASKFGRPCEAIRYEDQRINLFAIGRRAP
jgi:SAM-dependent methyltransferase